MAGISTADDTTESLDTLRGRWRYALSRIKSDPHAGAYVADFVAFGSAWAAIDHREMGKEDAITDAEAAAATADEGLDRLSRQVSGAIFGGKKVDVTLPVAMVYFGGVAPSEFMRPQLGKQLIGMTGWPALLGQATQQALKALAPEGAAVVPAAETAAKTLIAAIADRDLFHDGGERKSLFDQFNALCAKAYGGLKAFVHSHPELDLPVGYAESKFQQGVAASGPKTLGAANALVARLEQKLGRAKAVQSELAGKAAEAEAQGEEYKAALAGEAAARKAEAEARKARKAAEAETKKKKPKK
jgi:hypothetical protein